MASLDVARALDDLKAKLGVTSDDDIDDITADDGDRGLFGILTPATKRWTQ